MTAAFGLVLLALGVHYVIRLGAFARGFAATQATSDPAPEASGALPTVTVIVAARNEEAVIGRCVDAILASDMDPTRFEVLVADDDSSDATADIVRQRAERLKATSGVLAGAGDLAPEAERLRLVHVAHDPTRLRAHKKRAIEIAVAHARGDIILTTDADCLVPRAWVRTMSAAFVDPEVVFASGPVRYDATGGLFVKLQALDFLGLMACGAGGIGIGRPNLANGASVAYRRDVFERLGGFSGIDDITSGDDELLMQKIAYGGGWQASGEHPHTDPADAPEQAPGARGLGAHSVRFVNRPEATVLTEPVRSIGQFLDQRKRWASKGTRYPAQLQAMLVGLVAFFLALLVSALALPLAPGLWPWLVAALGLKAVGDLIMLVPATGRFRQRSLLWVYPLYGPLHVVHTFVVGIVGPLSSGFEWKGRRLDR